MSEAALYLLPVPLSPEDIHSIPEYNRRQMREIKYFVVERIRTARRFIRKLAPEVVIDELTFFELNKRTRPEELAEMLAPVAAGHDVGLMSESGMPGVADPGADLVRLAHERGIEVRPLTGPSSILLALAGSGLNGQAFCFHGYLPAKRAFLGQGLKKLEEASRKSGATQIFIETPYRNGAVWEECMKSLRPSTRLCIAVDLTAPGQYLVTRTIAQWRKNPPPEMHKRPAVFLLLA